MDTNLFNTLRQVADAVAATFGRNCEVAIHDLSNLKKSLCYLTGNITGRRIGASATDFLVEELQKRGKDIQDMYNYKTTTRNGRSMKSSTIFIRDHMENVVAALCINFDTTDVFNAVQSLTPFLNTGDHGGGESKETFAGSVPQTVEALFDQAVLEMGKQPATMSTSEKIRLTELLDKSGAFQLKGAVEQIAIMTGVSKFTIYNYLKRIRTGKTFNQI
jgi:predicted transcriptional regulator YheO